MTISIASSQNNKPPTVMPITVGHYISYLRLMGLTSPVYPTIDRRNTAKQLAIGTSGEAICKMAQFFCAPREAYLKSYIDGINHWQYNTSLFTFREEA
jgi:hypothetical protein